MKTMCPPSHMPHVPKCMSCHNTIEVINGRAYYFHDCIYITRSSFFCDIWALCVL